VELSKAEAKLTYNSRRHHVRRDYRLRRSYTHVWRVNRFASPLTKPHSQRNYTWTELAIRRLALGSPTKHS